LRLGYHPGKIRVNNIEGKRTNLGIARSTGWLLNISRIDEVREFAKAIDFADNEKQAKLEEAITFVDSMSRKEAAREWRKYYDKRGKKWTRIAK
jgi:hypothetical protein